MLSTSQVQGAPSRQMPLIKGVPLLGVAPALLSRPLERLLAARERCGDIFALDVGPARWVILCHPRHAEHVLVNHSERYRKGGPVWEAVGPLLGNGLVVSEGEFWLRQRRLLQPHFHRQKLAALVDVMVAAIDDTFASAGFAQAAASGAPFDLAAGFASVTMRVIVRTLFGQTLGSAAVERLSTLMTNILRFLPLGIAGRLLPAWLPVPGVRRYREQLAELDAIVHQIIAVERAKKTPSANLLSLLVAETADGGMTDSQLRDEVITFFLAGYETTSLALSWATNFLLQHPAVLAKAQGEVDQALAGRLPQFADLAALPYLKMVLQETMRLVPPSWWVPRTASVDDEIDGCKIAAGTMVVILTYCIHHNPTLFEAPQQFVPERFASGEATARHRLAWMPFGAGQRICIGKEFALIEAQLVLAMLLGRYRPSGVPGQTPRLRIGMTLRPGGGVKVKLAARPLPPSAADPRS